jgi:quercetin dioxygenase-like cupin family protein
MKITTGARTMKTWTIILLMIAFATAIPAIADPPDSAGTVHQLMMQPLPDMPPSDVVVITVDYPPGGTTPPHEHPGATYAYVLKGSVVSQLGDEPPHTYTEGQMWSETPHQRHMVSRNASATEPAKLLVFMVAPHGQALTTMLPAK